MDFSHGGTEHTGEDSFRHILTEMTSFVQLLLSMNEKNSVCSASPCEETQRRSSLL